MEPSKSAAFASRRITNGTDREAAFNELGGFAIEGRDSEAALTKYVLAHHKDERAPFAIS